MYKAYVNYRLGGGGIKVPSPNWGINPEFYPYFLFFRSEDLPLLRALEGKSSLKVGKKVGYAILEVGKKCGVP